MKELILILSYCPNKEKKESLLFFLKDLQSFRENYNILLVSHSKLDPYFLEYCDFYFYSEKNELLDGIEYRQNSWFSPVNDYVIWSSYTTIGNTLSAIWDMLIPSLSLAKSLSFEKIHYFEYDSRISSPLELEENSSLLETYDYIFYGTEDTHKLMGSFLSFKTDKIINEWKLLSHEVLPKLFWDNYPKVPENIIHDLISSQRKYLKKDYNQLPSKGVTLGLQKGGKVYWDVPFYEPKTNSLQFVSYNNNSEKYKLRIILNETELINVESLPEQNWKIFTLLEDFNLLTSLKVFRDENKILDLNFESQDFKNRFIKYNSLLGNSSIDPNIII
jgi:hypothetical protein